MRVSALAMVLLLAPALPVVDAAGSVTCREGAENIATSVTDPVVASRPWSATVDVCFLPYSAPHEVRVGPGGPGLLSGVSFGPSDVCTWNATSGLLTCRFATEGRHRVSLAGTYAADPAPGEKLFTSALFMQGGFYGQENHWYTPHPLADLATSIQLEGPVVDRAGKTFTALLSNRGPSTAPARIEIVWHESLDVSSERCERQSARRLVCATDPLPPGATARVVLVAKALADGDAWIDVGARAASSWSIDPSPQNDWLRQIVAAKAQWPRLDVRLDAPSQGEGVVPFDLTVENLGGPGVATRLLLDAPSGSSLEVEGCASRGPGVECAIGAFPPSTQRRYAGSARVAGAPVTIGARALDGDREVGRASVTIAPGAPPPPDVRLRLSGPVEVEPGARVEYVLVAQNAGQGEARDLRLLLGSNANGEVLGAEGAALACAAATCGPAHLAPGAEARATVVVAVHPDALNATPLTLTARAADGTIAPASATSTVLVPGPPDVRLSFEGPETLNAGEAHRILLRLRNVGAGGAPNLTLRLEGAGSASAIAFEEPCAKDACRVAWAPAGANLSFPVLVTLGPDAPIGANVSVEARGGPAAAARYDARIVKPDLRLALAAPSEAAPGERFEIVGALTNVGSGTAGRFDVELGTGLFTQHEVPQVGRVLALTLDGQPCDSGRKCPVAGLAPGSRATLRAQAQIEAGASNGARWDLPFHVSTSLAPIARLNLTVADRTADLVLTEFSASPAVPRAGDPVTVRIAVENRGPGASRGTYVETRLPEGIDADEDREGPCVRVDRDVRCFFGALDPGTRRELDVTVTPTLPGEYAAILTVGATGTRDPVASNDARELRVRVTDAAGVVHEPARWRALAPLPAARHSAYGGLVDGRLVVAGGALAGAAAETFLYDPARNTWSRGPDMPSGGYGGASASVAGELWALGGWRGRLPTSDVRVFDGAWRSAPVLPKLSGCSSAAAHGTTTIYLFSGCDGHSGFRKEVWAYDRATGASRALPSPPSGHVNGAAVVAGDALYLLGGGPDWSQSTSTVSRYDPSTGAWSTLARMPTARTSAGAALLEGRIYVAGGVSHGVVSRAVEAYDPATDTWQTLDPMPTARSAPVVLALGRTLYVVGGSGAAGALTTVEALDVGATPPPPAPGWERLPGLPAARHAPFAGAVGAKLLVAGGHAGGPQSAAWTYDPASRAWSAAASMPAPRQGGASAEWRGELWRIGGWSQRLPHSDVGIFNATTNAWRAGPALAKLSGCSGAGASATEIFVFSPCDGRSGYRRDAWSSTGAAWSARAAPGASHIGPAAAATDLGFFLLGGSDESGRALATVSRLDPATGVWATRASMPTPRLGAAAAVFEGRIYVVGGYADGRALDVVEVYDPARDAWSRLDPLPTARSGLAAAVLDGVLYAVGGSAGGVASAAVEALSLRGRGPASGP